MCAVVCSKVRWKIFSTFSRKELKEYALQVTADLAATEVCVKKLRHFGFKATNQREWISGLSHTGYIIVRFDTLSDLAYGLK